MTNDANEIIKKMQKLDTMNNREEFEQAVDLHRQLSELVGETTANEMEEAAGIEWLAV